MGYIIAAAVVYGLIYLSSKKKRAAPGITVNVPPQNDNGYAGYDPPTRGLVPQQDVPSVDFDPAPVSWDDYERVPGVIFQSGYPYFFKVTNGMTGRIYKSPSGRWQTAVYKSFIRVWPEGPPTGYTTPGQALAAGWEAKQNLAG